jgi:hypothetical protein
MKLLYFHFLLCFLLFSPLVYAQPYFQWNDSIPVKVNGATIAYPWAGGLNYIQPSNIDMNMDGIPDLFVFDRTGNKVRTFINQGTVGAVDFKYDPQYESKFPAMHDWVLLVDYNCDNKEDIFTCNGGSFSVYKNTSDNVQGLQFELVTLIQRSYYDPPAGQLGPLYITPVDIPSFTDVDNDGDLDVVTFTNSGSYLQYHQNQSMELYGVCDSLIFEIRNRCWGYVSESAFSNNYTLHDTCTGNVSNPELPVIENSDDRSSAHQGGCSLCLDLDADGDKDFIVGDVSYNNLTMLTNGGTPTAASFIAKDVAFPSGNGGSAPVNLPVFPCAFSVDVNNDGVKDLIACPNAPSLSENYKSVIYFQNTGTSNFPVFQLQQTNLLQDNMIELSEGAYPVFFDYNNDGLQDLFVGNYGYYTTSGFGFQTKIALFKNTGVANHPEFTLITRDYANLSTLGINNMVPAFGDMDADGDSDMILGAYDGKLHYFENTAAIGDSANFVLTQSNLRNSNNQVIDVGDLVAPQIVDVDGDQKNDLVIGGRNGKLAYFHHTGNASASIPVMDSVSYYWGEVKVNRPGYFVGYSHPFVFKQNGITKLLVGEESGYVRMYDNIDAHLVSGAFTLADTTYQGIFQGTRTAINGTDLDNDGFLDLMVGNYEGGLSYYKGSAINYLSVAATDNSIHWDADLFPNPANTQLTVRIKNGRHNGYMLDVYSVLGQHLISQKLQNDSFTLDTQNLPQGVYIVKLSGTTGNSIGVKTKRIVIQH